MDFGQILSRGWNIVWNNKWLWWLGLLAGLSGALSNGGGNNLSYNFSSPEELQQFLGVDPNQIESTLQQSFEQFLGVALGVGCLFILIAIGLWLLSHAARAGMIKAVVELDSGGAMTWAEALRLGWRYVGRVILMNILLALPIIVAVIVAIVAGAGALATSLVGGATADDLGNVARALGAMFLCLVPLLCLAFVLGLIVQFVGAFGYRGIVLRDMGVMDGIRHGWQVFRSRLADSFLLGIIFGVIGLIFSLVIGAILGGLALVGLSSFIGDILAGRAITAGQFVNAIVLGLLVGVLRAVLNSILVAWRSSSVTLAYLEFTGGLQKAPVGPDVTEPLDPSVKAM